MAEENQENNKEGNDEPKKDIPLFRKEALEHRKGSYLGKSIIITPIAFSVWTFGITLIAIAVGLFVYYGKYANRQEVVGMLVPNKGLIRIYPQAEGTVAEKFVKQGEKVTKGQLLYLISTERHGLSEQGTIAQQVEILEKQIETQKNKLALSEQNLERYKKLIEQKFVTEPEYQKAYDEYLNNQLALRETENKLIEIKRSGDHALRAPEDGIVSNLVAMVGDHVHHDRPIVTIIPEGAVLQGILFVQSEAIGFVKVGQKVLLKYDAYPYQRFGLYESTISSVDKSALYLKDLDLQLNISTDQKNPYKANEPVYRVMVDLKQQTVSAYGKPIQLNPGMTLRGSIVGDERRIWQWILHSIYSLRGSLITHE